MGKKKSIAVEGNISVAGVYSLTTKEGKVVYVGSSLELGDSLSRHNYNCRRGKYQDTNKRLIQECFDREDLVFKVLHMSAYNDEVRTMSQKQKEDLQKALSVIEETYIFMYRNTICNKQMSVTKSSSNKNSFTTYKRRIANTGEKNPRAIYDDEVISNILYLKGLNLKHKDIIELLLEHDIDMSSAYISRIGVDRWIHLEPKKPEWFNDKIAN